MALTLTNSRLKLARAHQHLTEFDACLKQWLATDPLRMHWVPDPDVARETLWLDCATAPPPELGLMAGDFAHNVRSALDNAFANIFISNGGDIHSKEGRRVAYPCIANVDRASLDKQLEDRYFSEFIPAAAREVIRRYQPFAMMSTFERQPWLWHITNLNNSDKHVAITLAAVAVREVQSRAFDGNDHVVLGINEKVGVLTAGSQHDLASHGLWTDHGSGVFAPRSVPIPGEKPTVGLQVCLHGTRGTMPLSGLGVAHQVTAEVVELLEEVS